MMSTPEIQVQFPSGAVKTVNMFRLLVQAQNAEFKAKYGVFLPGLAKLHPTVAALREEYEIPKSVCRTWADAARILRTFYDEINIACFGQTPSGPSKPSDQFQKGN